MNFNPEAFKGFKYEGASNGKLKCPATNCDYLFEINGVGKGLSMNEIMLIWSHVYEVHSDFFSQVYEAGMKQSPIVPRDIMIQEAFELVGKSQTKINQIIHLLGINTINKQQAIKSIISEHKEVQQLLCEILSISLPTDDQPQQPTYSLHTL